MIVCCLPWRQWFPTGSLQNTSQQGEWRRNSHSSPKSKMLTIRVLQFYISIYTNYCNILQLESLMQWFGHNSNYHIMINLVTLWLSQAFKTNMSLTQLSIFFRNYESATTLRAYILTNMIFAENKKKFTGIWTFYNKYLQILFLGDPLWQSYFTFVTFKHLFFPLNSHY